MLKISLKSQSSSTCGITAYTLSRNSAFFHRFFTYPSSFLSLCLICFLNLSFWCVLSIATWLKSVYSSALQSNYVYAMKNLDCLCFPISCLQFRKPGPLTSMEHLRDTHKSHSEFDKDYLMTRTRFPLYQDLGVNNIHNFQISKLCLLFIPGILGSMQVQLK